MSESVFYFPYYPKNLHPPEQRTPYPLPQNQTKKEGLRQGDPLYQTCTLAGNRTRI